MWSSIHAEESRQELRRNTQLGLIFFWDRTIGPVFPGSSTPKTWRDPAHGSQRRVAEQIGQRLTGDYGGALAPNSR